MKTVNLQQLVLILILLEVGLLVVRLEKRACISFCVLILILLEVGLLVVKTQKIWDNLTES